MAKSKVVKLAPEPAPNSADAPSLPTAMDFLNLLGRVTQEVASIAMDKDNTPTDRTRAAAVAGGLALKGIEAVGIAQGVHDAQRARAIGKFKPDTLWNPYNDTPAFNPFASVEYQEAVGLLTRDAESVGLGVEQEACPHQRGLPKKKTPTK